MKVIDIAIALRNESFTIDELNVIRAAFKDAIDKTQRTARRSFFIGQKVFNAQYGEGVVESIGPKNIMVQLNSGRGRLRASPSGLTAVA